MTGKSQAARTKDRVRTLIEGVVVREGYELLDVEVASDRGRAILRLYIDTIPPSTKETGVTVDDCQHVSRIAADVLEVEDPIGGEYNLEVSSPGLFRPLTKPEHFDRVLGERVKVKTFEKQGDRRVFTGVLTKREGEALTVDVDGQPFVLDLSAIAKANLEPVLDF